MKVSPILELAATLWRPSTPVSELKKMNNQLKLLTFSISILLVLLACGNANNNKRPHSQEKGIQSSDTSMYTVLKFDTADTWLFTNCRPTSLRSNEIQEIDFILKQCIAVYNPGQKLEFDSISKVHPEYNLKVQNFIVDLSRYKRQYFPVINSFGQKEVWVNCFCNDFNKNWRNEMVIVKDGGNCYFNLIINLTTKSFYQFIVNGDV